RRRRPPDASRRRRPPGNHPAPAGAPAPWRRARRRLPPRPGRPGPAGARARFRAAPPRKARRKWRADARRVARRPSLARRQANGATAPWPKPRRTWASTLRINGLAEPRPAGKCPAGSPAGQAHFAHWDGPAPLVKNTAAGGMSRGATYAAVGNGACPEILTQASRLSRSGDRRRGVGRVAGGVPKLHDVTAAHRRVLQHHRESALQYLVRAGRRIGCAEGADLGIDLLPGLDGNRPVLVRPQALARGGDGVGAGRHVADQHMPRADAADRRAVEKDRDPFETLRQSRGAINEEARLPAWWRQARGDLGEAWPRSAAGEQHERQKHGPPQRRHESPPRAAREIWRGGGLSERRSRACDRAARPSQLAPAMKLLSDVVSSCISSRRAFTTSPMLTIPASDPSRSTGMWRMRRCVISAARSATLSCGVQVKTRR